MINKEKQYIPDHKRGI